MTINLKLLHYIMLQNLKILGYIILYKLKLQHYIILYEYHDNRAVFACTQTRLRLHKVRFVVTV